MDIINIISLGAISIQVVLAVIFVILNKIDKRQDSNKLSEPDNPLLLTIQAMEGELDELRQNNAYMKHIQKLEEQIKEAKTHAEALSKVAGNYGSTMEEVGESIVGSVGVRDAVHTVTPVNSNGIVVGGILSKGLVVEKPEEKIESTCENESETDKKTREYEETRKEEWLKNEQDKTIRETKELLRKVDKSIHKAECGKWNTIPKALSHEERVSITRQNTAIYRTYTKQAGWSSYYDVKLK